MKKQIKVSCGILQKENKYLLVQRPAHSQNGLKWEFPGGKLEENETAEDCLIRELKEELDITVSIQKRLEHIHSEGADYEIELIPFCCKIVDGKITLLEHLAQEWISLDLPLPSDLNICLGDIKIIELLQKKS